MAFLATVYPSPRPQPMKFPVFSQLAQLRQFDPLFRDFCRASD